MSKFIPATKQEKGSFINISYCKECGFHGAEKYLRFPTPCPECGGKIVEFVRSGKWNDKENRWDLRDIEKEIK